MAGLGGNVEICLEGLVLVKLAVLSKAVIEEEVGRGDVSVAS